MYMRALQKIACVVGLMPAHARARETARERERAKKKKRARAIERERERERERVINRLATPLPLGTTNTY